MAITIEEWHWEITRRCNLNCLHCINGCGSPREDELSIKEVLKAIKTMASLGCRKLMITGGEPLVRQGLPIILKECREHGIGIQLLTNGVLIDYALAKQLAQAVEAIGVSLDGSTAEINDSIRGRGSFTKICQAISSLKDYIPVTVYFTASGVNFHEMEKTIKLAWSLGASRVHVSEVIMEGRALDNRGLFQLSEGQKDWLCQFARQSTGNHRKPEENCNVNLSSPLYLASNGLVYPCTEVERCPSLSLGRINKKSFIKEILERKMGLAGSSSLSCSYQVYAGNNLVFYLKRKVVCPLVEKTRLKDDKDA